MKKLLEEEITKDFENDRDELRQEAKQQIQKTQEENKKSYNLRRRPPSQYKRGDIVAIKRTQCGPGHKLKPKFLGPYRITKVKPGNTYDVEKDGVFDGPKKTSTAAEFVKPWVTVSSEADDDLQEGRV